MDEFRTCLQCGYQRGFHISFKKDGKGFMIILICPECGAAYDIGLVEDRFGGSGPDPEKKGNFPEK